MGRWATVVDPSERVITTQSEFRWLRPLNGERMRARGEVLRRGRSVSHCKVELFDAEGVLLGTGAGTCGIVAPAAGGAA